MSKSISIHDTHRIPYFNATLTAVEMESGNSNPAKFVDYEGNELGYEVYSNNRGFLCDSTGTLYTSGVFVQGKSQIVCTIRDGSSTSWVVGEDNKEAINDGKVLTKTGRQLFSANSNSDWTLSVQDIEDMPPLNQWKENQQICFIENIDDSVDIDEFTKALIILPKPDADWSALANPATQCCLTLTPQVNRFGQRLCIWNMCGVRISLKNAVDGAVFATVDPQGFLPVSLYCYNNLSSWAFKSDVDYQQLNSLDGNITLSGYVAYQGFSLPITDRTPEYQILSYNSIGLDTDNDGVLIKCNLNLTFPRRIKFHIIDTAASFLRAKNGRLMVYNTGNVFIGAIRFKVGEDFEVMFPAGTLPNDPPQVMSGALPINEHNFEFGSAGNPVGDNDELVVPPLCDKVKVYVEGSATALTLKFPNEKNMLVLDLERVSPVGTLNLAIQNQNAVSICTVAITGGTYIKGIVLCNGIVAPLAKALSSEWNP